MPRLTVLCAIPGSGKTTLANELAKHGAKLYCFDAIPKALSPTFCEAVRCQMWQDIAADLRHGYDVICDDGNTLKRWRKGILAATENAHCERVLIVLNTPLDVCLERNRNRKHCLPDFVIIEAAKQYESPGISEGWNEIKYI